MQQVAQPKAPEEQRQLLARHIQMAVATGGRVESQSDTMAVIVRGKPVNHVLHLILTLATFGLWGIVWLIVAVAGGEKREMITVDEHGQVLVQKV